MQVSFVVPIKCMSWTSLNGKSYWARVKLFREVEDVTITYAQYAKLQPINPVYFPLTITFAVSWKGKRLRDIDSIASLKPIMDSLVKIGILPDDNVSIVYRVIVTGRIGQKADGVSVTITESSSRLI